MYNPDDCIAEKLTVSESVGLIIAVVNFFFLAYLGFDLMFNIDKVFLLNDIVWFHTYPVVSLFLGILFGTLVGYLTFRINSENLYIGFFIFFITLLTEFCVL